MVWGTLKKTPPCVSSLHQSHLDFCFLLSLLLWLTSKTEGLNVIYFQMDIHLTSRLKKIVQRLKTAWALKSDKLGPNPSLAPSYANMRDLF